MKSGSRARFSMACRIHVNKGWSVSEGGRGRCNSNETLGSVDSVNHNKVGAVNSILTIPIVTILAIVP